VHQIDALRRGGVEEDDVYVDVASGVKASRPKFDLVMKLLRDGDTLKVADLNTAATLPDRNAERRRRLAEPDLDLRAR
jgi:DNA invertase Pin-like site-specific DNA recombinase